LRLSLQPPCLAPRTLHSEEGPMAQLWKVIGGSDKGGIVVRQGSDLKSEQESDRLSTDAIVKELALVKGRLNYGIVSGKGPQTGWVSIALTGKELCIKVDAEADEEVTEDVSLQRMTLEYQQSDACKARCEAELAKKVPAWKPITQQLVVENHMKSAPGMLYGIDFPFTEKMLIDMGPAWLTKAFHTAGTLDEDNAVTKVIPEKKLKITTGNNGGKFLFEVRYKKQVAGLHTKLFAKIPHSYDDKKTASDRLSSSVNKQPMELYELNSSRLLESTLPVKIPKLYFGDISNETSNFILITEQVPFSDPEPMDYEGKLAKSGKRNEPLPPYQIEGPYDKCMDWTLRGSPFEYYLLLVRTGAKMAGLHKAGKMGDPAALASQFENWSNVPAEMFGINPKGCTGKPPKMQKAVVDSAVRFMSDDGKHIFPPFCSDSGFQKKFYDVMMTLNAYSAESNYWKHANQDYIALTHNNLNVDNAFFWRNDSGELELGVLDWGSTGQRSLGFKMWWWLYCSDFDVLTEKIDDYLKCFVDTYAEFGGPVLDVAVLKSHFILTAMEQMAGGLCPAVPQIFKMCPKKNWPEIKDRYDSRIGGNIDGKSTMRLYLHVMSTIVGMIQDPRWQGDKVLDKFIEDFCKASSLPKKEPSMIFP